MPRGGPVYRHDTSAKRAAQPASLTASARVYDSAEASRKVRKTGRATNSRVWQEALWDFYDEVPEFRMGCDWVGNALSRVQLTVLKNGKPTTDQAALDALASLFSGEIGQREMFRLFGINFTVAGEAWLIGEVGDDGYDEWRVVAAVEVSGEGQDSLVIEGARVDTKRSAIIPIRTWKAHPRKSDEANSPSRAIIPILQEIVTLTQVVDAQASSRLNSAGILWVPTEADVQVQSVMNEGEETIQPADNNLSLYDTMIRNAATALADRDSAAAQVPIVVSVPGEYLEKAQHTEFWSGFDEHAKTLRDEAIRRIAVGMDLPPEVLTGTAEVNHWGQWQIEEAAIKSYIEPLGELLADSLSSGYLHHFLRGEGVADAEDYTFGIDTTKLRLRPNRSKESVELYDRGVVNAETVLRENGFDVVNDAMTDTERATWLTVMVAKGSTTPDQVAGALQVLGVALPQLGAGDEGEAANPSQHRRSLRDHPSEGPPDPDDSEAQDAKVEKGLVASAGTPLDGLVYASEMMVFRALERAGNRLKTLRSDRPAGVAAADLYRHLSEPLTFAEANGLLEDAWGAVDRVDYPGVNREALKLRLNTYALTLLISGGEPKRSQIATMLEGAT